MAPGRRVLMFGLEAVILGLACSSNKSSVSTDAGTGGQGGAAGVEGGGAGGGGVGGANDGSRDGAADGGGGARTCPAARVGEQAVSLEGPWTFTPVGGAATTIQVPGGGWLAQGF